MNIFVEQQKNNAQIYEDVFNTLPTNHFKMFVDVEKYSQHPKLKETDLLALHFIFSIYFLIKAHEKCKEIQSFIVEFPLE